MTLTPNFLPVGSIVNPISGDHRFNKPLKEVYCRIVSINETSCEVKQVNDDSDASPWKFHLTNIAGIPLTPEILTEWCGFHKVEENQYRLGFKLLVNRDGKWFDYGSNVQLDYLNELQLLFAAHKTVLPITIK